jgi:thiamine-phosphate pyrophosphorylase
VNLSDVLRLVYIVDAEAAADGDRLDALMGGGVTALWLRAPDRSGADLYRIARALQRRCEDHGTALVVGDRADVALAVGAHGVQLGPQSPPAARIRAHFPSWLGVSCHDAADLRAARDAGADYAVLSPLYGLPERGPPLGPAAFARLVADAGLPVVALGGIDAANAAAARDVGAAGVAVIRALREAPDPAGEARRLAAPRGTS